MKILRDLLNNEAQLLNENLDVVLGVHKAHEGGLSDVFDALKKMYGDRVKRSTGGWGDEIRWTVTTNLSNKEKAAQDVVRTIVNFVEHNPNAKNKTKQGFMTVDDQQFNDVVKQL